MPLHSEWQDLSDLRRSLSDLPAVAFDAAAHRMRSFKRSAIQVRTARSGSIILMTAMSGLSIRIFQQTLGETLSRLSHKFGDVFVTVKR